VSELCYHYLVWSSNRFQATVTVTVSLSWLSLVMDTKSKTQGILTFVVHSYGFYHIGELKDNRSQVLFLSDLHAYVPCSPQPFETPDSQLVSQHNWLLSVPIVRFTRNSVIFFLLTRGLKGFFSPPPFGLVSCCYSDKFPLTTDWNI